MKSSMKYEDRLREVYEATSTQDLIAEYYSGEQLFASLVPQAAPIIERILQDRGYSKEKAKLIWEESRKQIASSESSNVVRPTLIGRQSFYEEWSSHLDFASKNNLPACDDVLDYFVMKTNPRTAAEIEEAKSMEDQDHAQIRNQRFRSKSDKDIEASKTLPESKVDWQGDKSSTWTKWLAVLVLMAAVGKLVSHNGPIGKALSEAKQNVEKSAPPQEIK